MLNKEFFVRFVIGGLVIAGIPILAHYTNNKIAGFILLFPILLISGLIAQYVANGQYATQQLIHSALIGLPALIMFILVSYLLLKLKFNLTTIIITASLIWLITILIINKFIKN